MFARNASNLKMRMSKSSLTVGAAAFVMLAVWCFGASPVATISSAQSVVVSGISVPANRVMSWPVSVNDEIVTQSAPATVRFADGTVVMLQRNSRMRLEQSAAGVKVNMLAGSAMYDVKPNSRVSLGPKPASVRLPGGFMETAARPGVSGGNSANSAALAYRMPATQPSSGVIFAPMAISAAHFSTAQFLPAATRQEYTIPSNGPTVVLPSGVILEVTPVPNAPGQYTINRILVPVTNPGGQLVYANVVTSPLIGAGLAVLNQGTASQQITIFNGANPLTPDQANAALQQAAQNAVSNAPGATIRPTGPITVDPVSPAR